MASAFSRIRPYLFTCLLLLSLTIVISFYPPTSVDWIGLFRPAIREMLFLRSPFELPRFVNPPWAMLPLIILYPLPINLSRAILTVVSLSSVMYTLWRMGAKPLVSIAVLLSPPMIQTIIDSSLDWMVVLGFIMPPTVGLFFVMIKPQVGAGVALFWLVEAWRKGRFLGVVKTFAPVTAAYLVSFVLFGFWPFKMGDAMNWGTVSTLFPWTIPSGLILLLMSILRRDLRFAAGASPCLSPYLLLHSWLGAVVAIAASKSSQHTSK